MDRENTHRPLQSIFRAVRVSSIGIAAYFLAVVGPARVASISAAGPGRRQPVEVVGPIAPSFHVPPVRTAAPRRTKPIARRPQYDPETTAHKRQLPYRMESLRLAIEDLIATFGGAYPDGPQLIRRWESLERAVTSKEPDAAVRFRRLRDEALLANPLLDFQRLLVLKRRKGQPGLPTNHQCNTCLKQDGYDNELAVLSPVRPDGSLATLFRPNRGQYVGEMDLHYAADRLLFTMPNGRTWQVFEIGVDGKGLRQVSHEAAGVDNFDACYLPDGRMVFSSTASLTGVPCWHGRERACCLYSMDADGGDVRQLCFDQDLDLHASVMHNGQVIYSRWDYTGILHAYVRPLMVMNPDGTGQRAVYGSNSYYPNCLFFPRAVPGHRSRIVAILSGYHGKNRMGELAVLDAASGWSGAGGIVHRITHRGEPIVPIAIDCLTEDARPQFLHPYPLSDKYILTAMHPGGDRAWGIYLVDVFDNVTPVLTDPSYDFFEPLPVRERPIPPVVPDRTDRTRDDAIVVLHDVYRGPGLKGVPRGTVKRLRVAAYHFGFPGMAGPDKIGRGGPWEVMRILGTVPVYEDGSAKFRVPASTPITLQALDAEGKAVQLMRSWYTAMPGETASCVGCHETPGDTPPVRSDIAAAQRVSEIQPWYGPARGFDFAREVQPMLDKYCVGCHDGRVCETGTVCPPDLRDEKLVRDYAGLPLTQLGAARIDPAILARFPDRFQPCKGMPDPYGELRTVYTPAYEALIPFIRRVNIEDGASLLRPGEYHADTSELIELLRYGHHGVELDDEAWDRLITWIDLNGPCHGTWGEVADIPEQAGRRRYQLALVTGGPRTDPELIPISSTREPVTPVVPDRPAATREARARQASRLFDAVNVSEPAAEKPMRAMTLDLGDQVTIELVRIPAGRFVLGDSSGNGQAHEWPPSIVKVTRGFWIGRTEVTNAQLRRFLPAHSSGYFTKRQIDRDGPGVQLDTPNQPAVRVSWMEAMQFCRRLSEATGRRVALPSEAQWEYAARAATSTELWYGGLDADFSNAANMADRSLACLYTGTAGVAVLQPIPSVMSCDDLAIATAEVASYRANPWGLYDVHGNAAEWTRTIYRSYPYHNDDGRNGVTRASGAEKRVVRGGSFYDRPRRCRSAHRRAYPAWQGVHDVGLRIVVEDPQ